MHFLTRILRNHQPELWSMLAPKHYVGADQHCPPSIPATTTGSSIVAVYEGKPDRYTRSIWGNYLVATQLVEHRVPTYFLSNSLLKAVSRSQPPGDLDFRDVPMPYSGVLFLLPSGALIHPKDGEYRFLMVGRISKGDTIASPEKALPSPYPNVDVLRYKSDLLQVVSSQLTHDDVITCDFSLADNNPTVADVLNYQYSKEPGSAGYTFGNDGSVVPIEITEDDSQFNKTLMLLALQILLVMDARPDLVEEGGPTGKRTKRGTEIWTPSWVGRNYRIKVEDGSHASPNLHWRRGHYRNQAHGPRMSERKIIWVEPTMVGK